MASLTQIIAYVDRKFPNSESTANKVVDLNYIHTRVFTEIQRLKNDVEVYEIDTIADQPTYSLPSNCRTENIIKLEVATDTTNTEYDVFEYVGLNDDIDNRQVYGKATEDTIIILDDDGEPVSTASKKIIIYYYPRPTALSSSTMSQIPELDEDYHDILMFALIQEMACQGDNPATQIADFWQKKYDERFVSIKKDLERRYSEASLSNNQIQENW